MINISRVLNRLTGLMVLIGSLIFNISLYFEVQAGDDDSDSAEKVKVVTRDDNPVPVVFTISAT